MLFALTWVNILFLSDCCCCYHCGVGGSSDDDIDATLNFVLLTYLTLLSTFSDIGCIYWLWSESSARESED